MFLYKRANGKYYVGFYIGKKRVNKSLKTSNKAVANERYRDFKTDNKTVRISDITRKALEYAEINTGKKTQSAYRLCLTRFREFLGDEKLSDISKTDIENYIGFRKGNKYSMNIEIAILKKSFEIARGKKWISENPAKEIKKFSPKSPVMSFGSEKETFLNELKLCGNINYYYAVVIALETGMRKAEICGLKWEQIEDGRIKLSNKIDNEPEYAYYGNDTENILNALRSRKVRSINNYIWGSYLNGRNLTRTFNRVRDKLGLSKYLRFHSTRHTAITRWANEQPFHIAQALARHRTPVMTSKYVHTGDEQLRKAVNK